MNLVSILSVPEKPILKYFLLQMNVLCIKEKYFRNISYPNVFIYKDIGEKISPV